MQKARSRLHSISPTTPQPIADIVVPTKPPSAHRRIPIRQPRLLGLYLKHIPTLILGLVSAWGTSYILTKVRPSQIQNIILPQSYLPLLISFFFTCFFISSFIFLHSRRGLIFSLLLTTLLFLQMQRVLLTTPLLMSIGIFFILLSVANELLFYFSRKK